MPVFVNGLPLHVLVVHAVVVLVPLAVVGTIVVALWPTARRRFGWLVVGLTALAAIAIPIATSSGGNLYDRVTPTELIHAHAELGDQLLVFVAGLLVVSVGLVWFDQRRRREAPGTARVPTKPVIGVLAALTIALGAVSAVQVVRIGDSGAKAAWSDVHYTEPPSHHDG